MKIALTSIPVSDPVKAFEFYTNVLGFKEQMFMPEYSLAIVVSAEDAYGTALLLEPITNPISREYQDGLYTSSLPVIVLGTTDIHEKHKQLILAGVDFVQNPTETSFGIQAIFNDTCGNLVQLHQNKPSPIAEG